MSWQTRVNVAVAVIINRDNDILITRRAHDRDFGGFWEFPGGKIEAIETARQCLYREIYEELNITIKHSCFIGTIDHSYPHKNVKLHVYLVDKFNGEPICQDNQLSLKWCGSSKLNQLKFPAANEKIISNINFILDKN
jgi:8-oxo-dGTP diphosphatase